MISVRQTRDLPRASFRFRIATDTLAFSYVLTANGSHSGLSPVRVRPCWANKKTISLNEIVLFITYFTPMTKLSRAASTTSVVIVSRLLISNILSIWVKSLWISRKFPLVILIILVTAS